MASVIATCREKGAFVAEIRDQKANDAILAMRKSQNKTFVISSGTDEAEEGKWVCKICDISYAQSGGLYVHNQSIHGPKRFKCVDCDQMFSKKEMLTRHTMSKHTKRKPYQCNECNQSFFYPSALRDHQNTHSGLKPYNCELCDKSFTSQRSLRLHLMNKHTERKPHQCSQCDLSFFYLGDLRNHQNTHSGLKPYKCEPCDKSYTSKRSLLKHTMSKHTKKKPHQCNQCDLSFFYLGLLRDHQNIHSGLKPYKCEPCDQSFRSKRSLLQHLKSIFHQLVLKLE